MPTLAKRGGTLKSVMAANRFKKGFGANKIGAVATE